MNTLLVEAPDPNNQKENKVAISQYKQRSTWLEDNKSSGLPPMFNGNK